MLWLSFSFSLLVCVQSVIVREYNAINFVEVDTFEKFTNVYMNIEKNILNQNILLGVASPECWDNLRSPAFRGAQRHSGGGELVVVTLPSNQYPYQLDECAQIFFYRKGSLLNQPTESTTEFDHKFLNQWIADRARISITFRNGFNHSIKLYWHEESSIPVFQGLLEPGKSIVTNSIIGHVFSANSIGKVYDGFDNTPVEFGEESRHEGYQNIIDFMVVSDEIYIFSPFNRLETCEIIPQNDLSPVVGTFAEQAIDCGNMYLRLYEFAHNIWYIKRLGLNYVQPQLVEPVTESGFEHRQLPVETYQWLREWYHEQQKLIEQEESSSGPCMNQVVAPSAITHLTPELKTKLSNELRHVLEEWYGGPLLLTSIYGVRKYNNNSVLRMHVDTVNTHVVSAIINVDQEVDEDWPLLILDHEDNEHSLVMQPGDMVLYESAKLLHGRPQAFVGKHYDNIFIHYKPVSKWDYSWM